MTTPVCGENEVLVPATEVEIPNPKLPINDRNESIDESKYPSTNEQVDAFCMDKDLVLTSEVLLFQASLGEHEVSVLSCEPRAGWKGVSRWQSLAAAATAAEKLQIDGTNICGIKIGESAELVKIKKWDSESEPVEHMSWESAEAFCRAQGETLLTDAQWYAAFVQGFIPKENCFEEWLLATSEQDAYKYVAVRQNRYNENAFLGKIATAHPGAGTEFRCADKTEEK